MFYSMLKIHLAHMSLRIYSCFYKIYPKFPCLESFEERMLTHLIKICKNPNAFTQTLFGHVFSNHQPQIFESSVGFLDVVRVFLAFHKVLGPYPGRE